MEVASVGASGAYSNNTVQSARPQPAAQEQQQVERREQQRQERPVEQTESTARPVTNAQGQQTGTTISVTA